MQLSSKSENEHPQQQKKPPHQKKHSHRLSKKSKTAISCQNNHSKIFLASNIYLAALQLSSKSENEHSQPQKNHHIKKQIKKIEINNYKHKKTTSTTTKTKHHIKKQIKKTQPPAVKKKQQNSYQLSE